MAEQSGPKASPNSSFELDIDRERVCVDGEWLGVDDLSARISEKVKAGDYRVAALSMALEQLQDTLSQVRSVVLKLTPEVLETYERLAEFEEQPLAMLLRQALVHYIGTEDAARRLYRGHRAEQRARATRVSDGDEADAEE